jgi:hypothetical protein
MTVVTDRCCDGERRKMRTNEKWALFIQVVPRCLVGLRPSTRLIRGIKSNGSFHLHFVKDLQPSFRTTVY